MRRQVFLLTYRYLFYHYAKRYILLLAVLTGAFTLIDYFQHLHRLPEGFNFALLYIYYVWQEALGLLYPLVMVLAILVFRLSLAHSNAFVALHALGWDKKRLFFPVAIFMGLVYGAFVFLQTTQFAYAKEKADFLLKHQMNVDSLENLFFKYNDWFVYAKKLDPQAKKMFDLTLFKVSEKRVEYTARAPWAIFQEPLWIAHDALMKRHIYQGDELVRYEIIRRARLETLKGYKPAIIKSFYEGKALSLVDALETLILFRAQDVDTQKIETSIYAKVISPLFGIALAAVMFFKLPYHRRMMHVGKVVSVALFVSFSVWGMLFGLEQLAFNGVIPPELAILVPVAILWFYAAWVYRRGV